MGMRNLFAGHRRVSLPYALKGRFQESQPNITVLSTCSVSFTLLMPCGIFKRIFLEKIKIAKQLYLADSPYDIRCFLDFFMTNPCYGSLNRVKFSTSWSGQAYPTWNLPLSFTQFLFISRVFFLSWLIY